MAPGDQLTEGLDQTQIELLKEECILVTEEDQPCGTASKKTCHLLNNINRGMLHRAFSVFLFNHQGDMLLQQRADAKITFPGHWTNTCCSHPLATEAESDETRCIGVRRAAQRKLQHELGIHPEQVPLDSFHFLTRIQYLSANVPHDGVWGEHEVDYVLFTQAAVDVLPNRNEVQSHRYVNRAQLQALLDSSKKDGTLITPWFRLIAERFLATWWDNLANLESVKDPDTIHNMVGQ